jgi:hypothetical protein
VILNFIIAILAIDSGIYFELRENFRIPKRELNKAGDFLEVVDESNVYPAGTRIELPINVIGHIVKNGGDITDRKRFWANPKLIRPLPYSKKDKDFFVWAKVFTPDGQIEYQFIAIQYLLQNGPGGSAAPVINPPHQTAEYIKQRYEDLMAKKPVEDRLSFPKRPADESLAIEGLVDGEHSGEEADGIMLLDCEECSRGCKDVGVVIGEKEINGKKAWEAQKKISSHVYFLLTNASKETIKVKMGNGTVVGFTKATMIDQNIRTDAWINLGTLLKRNCLNIVEDYQEEGSDQIFDECEGCRRPILDEEKWNMLGDIVSGITQSVTLRSGYVFPVPKYRAITSGFGMRIHPIRKRREHHNGIDISADKDSDILAVNDGVVIFSGRGNGYGKYVTILHDDGSATRYAHCNKLIAKKGERVSKGQLIAKVGRTGMATGNHLHFEYIPKYDPKRRYQKASDPLKLFGLSSK